MKQNIYDNSTFYNSYINLRINSNGLNDVLEIPAFRSLLPDLNNKEILDLGCGYGENCKWYVSQGAKKVVGIDISEKMIERALKLYSDEKIEYKNTCMEEIKFRRESFDMVLSSLAFHYVYDFTDIVKRISNVLKPGGILIFSQEHPIATAKKIPNGWFQDENGKRLHWILDNYNEEGIRKQQWFVDGVIKYHRTTSTIVNTLVENGFNLVKMLEPTATKKAENLNTKLKQERKRPPFLIIKAQKVN
ncbi:class I SAM-dependent methyltransferase [Clostridium sp. P21]|uniref:Class I SAM-dependent methyltransferase n=1 Tax=Clostridium muellerianum TaxID=2716538 RepID=A0A7Y0HQ21_9CLOT|nr:class I SAM-dependent methyltransferase [Clostridium muellerianum]NMM63288.1 class I SAM-dependent methyltransferase [Clostridium muellerianum]